MKKYVILCCSLFCLATGAWGQGSIVIWDESVNGPLSNSGNNPTSLDPFVIGINSVIGSSQQNGGTTAIDYFRISVPTGSELSSVLLTRDRQLRVWLGGADFSGTMGFSGDAQNGDLFSQWGLSKIDAGTYGFYVGNNDFSSSSSLANYRLDFSVTAVPEPSTLALGFLGVLGLLAFKRRSR